MRGWIGELRVSWTSGVFLRPAPPPRQALTAVNAHRPKIVIARGKVQRTRLVRSGLGARETGSAGIARKEAGKGEREEGDTHGLLYSTSGGGEEEAAKTKMG